MKLNQHTHSAEQAVFLASQQTARDGLTRAICCVDAALSELHSARELVGDGALGARLDMRVLLDARLHLAEGAVNDSILGLRECIGAVHAISDHDLGCGATAQRGPRE